jgi:hypothetical protein
MCTMRKAGNTQVSWRYLQYLKKKNSPKWRYVLDKKILLVPDNAVVAEW